MVIPCLYMFSELLYDTGFYTCANILVLSSQMRSRKLYFFGRVEGLHRTILQTV